MPFDMKSLTPDVAAATSSTILFGAIGGQTDGAPTPIPINILGTYIQANFGGASAANPTGTVGLTTVNGSATTFLRSDGAPPLSQSIAPTWTGQHTFNLDLITLGKVTAGGTAAANSSAGDITGARSSTQGGFYMGTDGNSYIFRLSGAVYINSFTLPVQLGAADNQTPQAQTLQVQNVAAGNSNISGANWTLNGSLSTGSGTSGDIIFQTGGTGAGATSQNALATAFTLKGATQQAIFATNVRINVAPTVNGSASTTITSGADSSTNLGHRISFNLNGTTYWIPCGSVAF